MGGARLPAALMDIPGNLIAKKLSVGEPVQPGWLARVLTSREASIRLHPTADRWFTAGRAFMKMGEPEKSADAFSRGLRHAPARGIAWAAYANALAAMGDASGAAAARRYSVERAPHDPRAVRLRRP
jgi:cytochrome c-type biogenesis protein CcmH/NrfG